LTHPLFKNQSGSPIVQEEPLEVTYLCLLSAMGGIPVTRYTLSVCRPIKA